MYEKKYDYFEYETQCSAVQKGKNERGTWKTNQRIPIMAAVLNPDLKSLTFMLVEGRAADHQCLLYKAKELVDMNGNIKVKVTKENYLPITVESDEMGESLPRLPSLPGQEENNDIIQIDKIDEIDEPASKKKI